MTSTYSSSCSRIFANSYIETELQARDESFCTLEQIRTLVMTWNAGATTPHNLRYAEKDKTFFPNLLKESGVPEILVFGFQELVDLEDKKTTASESSGGTLGYFGQQLTTLRKLLFQVKEKGPLGARVYESSVSRLERLHHPLFG